MFIEIITVPIAKSFGSKNFLQLDNVGMTKFFPGVYIRHALGILQSKA